MCYLIHYWSPELMKRLKGHKRFLTWRYLTAVYCKYFYEIPHFQTCILILGTDFPFCLEKVQYFKGNKVALSYNIPE